MQRLRKMKGFTLIELIVVVIIIGILAAVSAIAYNAFVAKSRVNAVLADARNASSIINSNAADKTADGKASSLVKDATTFAANNGLGATKFVSTAASPWKHYVVDNTTAPKVWCEVAIADVATVSDATCVQVKPATLP